MRPAFSRLLFFSTLLRNPHIAKDRTGVKESGLFDKIENLPQGYVCIGDCAYQPTERLVPIFGGVHYAQQEASKMCLLKYCDYFRIELKVIFILTDERVITRPFLQNCQLD